LPHKFSEYGPCLAAGDLDGDGLDDIVAGGNSSFPTTALIQQANGSFKEKPITQPKEIMDVQFQDMSTTLFDADQDGDLDLYISHGGYESRPNSAAYQDMFFVNDGKGNFTADSMALPQNYASKSCVRAADFDKDGDLDLFVAGRVEPWNYPKPVSSFIYRNDSKNGSIKFTDVTASVAGALNHIGLVCDALFTDYDNDGWPDLLLAGEWMPLTFLKNDKGKFINATAGTGIADQTGWWNSIAAGDFDKDGDLDYVVGNLGENSFFKASDQFPVSIYAKDFDKNDSYDAFLSIYLPASQDSLDKREFPTELRDDVIKQMISLRSKFQNYKSYAHATMDRLFTKEQLEGAQVLRANNFKSSYCRNDGNGKFTLVPLGFMAQLSALNGIVSDDFDGDGKLDLLMNTNDYGTNLAVGRYDALNGLLLKGDGAGNFIPLSALQAGIFIPGNGKAMIKLRGNKGQYLVAAGQNRGTLKLYKLTKDVTNIDLMPNEVSAVISYRDGSQQRREFFYGSSFLSQSARFITVDKTVASVTITNIDNKKRQVTL
jgi:hypothetical protein